MPDTSLVRFLAGILILLATAAPLVLGATRLRRALLPPQAWIDSAISTAVITLAGLFLCAQVLGAFGQLRSGYLAALCAAVGIAGFVAGSSIERGRPGHPAARPHAPEDQAPWLAGFAILCAALVGILWLAQSTAAMDAGVTTGSDTWWYHMPYAARFAESGSISGLHHVTDEPLASFLPADGSLLHAIGILGMGTDVLSPLINLGWLALALLSAWALGRNFDVAPHALVAVCVLLAVPLLRGSQPGEALVDTMMLSCFLAAVALLLASDGDRWIIFVSGLAMGLAVGTKVTALPVAGAIAVMLPWLIGHSERRNGLGATGRPAFGLIPIWVLGTVIAGGYWYLRNLLEAGSPAPFTDLPFGLDAPPSFFSEPPLSDSLLHDLLNGEAGYLESALSAQLGWVWPAVLAAVVAGLALGLLAGGRLRLLMVAAVIGFIAFSITPTTGSLFPGQLRHATAPLALSLVGMMAGLRAIYPRALEPAALALGLLVVIELTIGVPRRVEVASATLLIAALVVAGSIFLALLTTRARLAGSLAIVVVAGIGILAAGVRWHDGGGFVSGTFAESPTLHSLGRSEAPVAPAFEAMRTVSDRRVAVYGTSLQYPLYGRRLSNFVEFMGNPGPNGGYGPITSCGEWMRALAAGDFDYVLAAPFGNPRVRALEWTSSDPSAELILPEKRGFALFRIIGRPSPRSCYTTLSSKAFSDR